MSHRVCALLCLAPAATALRLCASFVFCAPVVQSCFVAEQYSMIEIYRDGTASRYLDCLQFETTASHATKNTLVYVFWWLYVGISIGNISGSGIARAQCRRRWDSIPESSCLLSLLSLQLWYCQLFIYFILANQVGVCCSLIVIFIWSVLVTNNEHVFICLSSVMVSALGILVQILISLDIWWCQVLSSLFFNMVLTIFSLSPENFMELHWI